MKARAAGGIAALLALASALAGCSGSDDGEGPGTVTRGEASAVGDAAQMLDTRAPASAMPSTAPPAPGTNTPAG